MIIASCPVGSCRSRQPGSVGGSVTVSSRRTGEKKRPPPAHQMWEVLQAALRATPSDMQVAAALRRALEQLAAHLEGLRPDIVRTTPAVFARAARLQDDLRRRLTEFAADRSHTDPGVDLAPHVMVAWAMAGLSAARELWERGATDRDVAALQAKAYLMLGDVAAHPSDPSDRASTL